jgi:hypothetical protein
MLRLRTESEHPYACCTGHFSVHNYIIIVDYLLTSFTKAPELYEFLDFFSSCVMEK